ncbi:MAG: NAD(+) synthase [Tissierellia bacterium]|nr:NAD(+) synthase [Tissierellia bacterium]
MDIKFLANELVLWLKERAESANAKGFVFGLSGGIDSAVVAAACKQALPNNSTGIIMPCHSIDEDEEHARIVAESLNITLEKVDLTKTFDALVEAAPKSEHAMAISNIKPRLRMTTLYYYAQTHGYLVVSGSNLSEFYTGYFTKFGDSGADILPLANILKKDVYRLAKYWDIPEVIIDKKPSAGLWKGQTDEQEMGFSYDELDGFIQGESIDSNIEEKIISMHNRSKHKRAFPPIFVPKKEKCDKIIYKC